MNTFLPWPSYRASAHVLDLSRLGKQRVEVLQIHNALTDPTYGWRNHPATRMWAGHEHALLTYGIAICDEWRSRGCRDSVRDQLTARQAVTADTGPPAWLGDDTVHRSHRSNLLRKQPDHYRQYFGDTPDDLPYHWPTP